MPEVRAVSLAGRTLLKAAVGRVDALRGRAERAAAALGVAHCRLIGPEIPALSAVGARFVVPAWQPAARAWARASRWAVASTA